MNDTAQLITSVVNAAASKAGRDGVYAPPPDTAPPRRRRRAASLRHLAEVIRTHRMAPGIAVDKDIVAGVLAGDLRYLTDLVPVVAVTRASHHIAGLPFGDDDVQRLAVAVAHLNALLTTAYEYDRRTPYLLPVPRPASALVVERNADRWRTAPTDVIQLAPVWLMPIERTPPRRDWTWLRPAAWIALLMIFASGVLVGVSGSRLADSSPPAANTPAHIASSACRPPSKPSASGAVVMGAPCAPSSNSTWRAYASPGELRHTPTGFVATVPAGSTLSWEFLVINSGFTMITGHRYRFDFIATSDRPLNILLRLQDEELPYRPSLVASVPIDRTASRRSYTFTAGTNSNAAGEAVFQLGGQGAYTVTVDDAVLIEVDS